MKKYPSIDDEKFYEKTENLFSKYEIPKKGKTFREFCFPKKFEPQNSQLFVGQFINPKTPYTGLLLYHEIGSGKTCASIKIAENFRGEKKIMVVLPASLKNNYRNELRTYCGENKYITEKMMTELKKLDPGSSAYQNIIKKSDELIDRYYQIYSYNKFANLIKAGDVNLKNTLLIIDEVHNMISTTGIYYELLYDLIKKAPADMRLIIMTATPIFDKPIEIALTLNLLIKGDEIPVEDFLSTFIKVEKTKNGVIYHMKNIKKFKNYIKGYVSYYSGAPEYVYPRHKIHIVKCTMSPKQLKLYNIINKESPKSQKIMDDYLGANIPNSFFIGSRMVSNIAFPNDKINLEGFESLQEEDLKLEKIKIYSPKFYKIYEKIKKCHGTIFIYSNFRQYGGLKSLVRFLEYHHYKNYEYHGSGEKRFAILSSQENIEIKSEILNIFNQIENHSGEKIKIILGSPSVKEGISFFGVREVHILEPYWNWSRLKQVMGRAIRFCSHKNYTQKESIVDVYIYLAVSPKLEASVDQKIFQMAVNKKYINGQFENCLKEAAVDCQLFRNANHVKCDK